KKRRHGPGQVRKHDASRRCSQRPERELPLGADVEKSALKSDGDREPGEKERGRVKDRHAEVVTGSERPACQDRKHVPRGFPRDEDDEKPQREAEGYTKDRLEETKNPDHRVPPPIRKPSSCSS